MLAPYTQAVAIVPMCWNGVGGACKPSVVPGIVVCIRLHACLSRPPCHCPEISGAAGVVMEKEDGEVEESWPEQKKPARIEKNPTWDAVVWIP